MEASSTSTNYHSFGSDMDLFVFTINFSTLQNTEEDISSALTVIRSSDAYNQEFVNWVNRIEIPLHCLNLKVSELKKLSNFSYLDFSGTNYTSDVIVHAINSSPHLRTLILNGTNVRVIQKLPEFLTRLEANNCKFLETLPSSIPHLTYFSGRNCLHLQTLPFLPNVEILDVSNCPNFDGFFGKLPNVRQITCISRNNVFRPSNDDAPLLQSFITNGDCLDIPKPFAIVNDNLVEGYELQWELDSRSNIEEPATNWWDNLFCCCSCFSFQSNQTRELQGFSYDPLIERN